MDKPAQIAANYIETGVTKARMAAGKILLGAIIAGLFVGVSGVGANTFSSGFANPTIARFASGAVFPVALAMILMAGGELFTGNTLLVIPLYEKQIKFHQVLRNWGLVYAGNFIGSLIIVALIAGAGQWGQLGGSVAVYTIKTAAAKCSLEFWPAFLLGIGCNFLVCTACWMSYGTKTGADKMLVIYLPVLMFVLCGFEHSVANMYYIPAGLIASANPRFAELAVQAGVDLTYLNINGFLLRNMLPVTLGNIIGGAGLIGTPYWFYFLRKRA